MQAFDYIIVGAGSAGCVLAARLAQGGKNSVLLIEAGGSDRHPWIRLPIGYGRLFYHQSLNWRYDTEADPGSNGRAAYWPRGKTVGGSSSINALVYSRGQPFDYDDWATAGATGWGWDAVKPHFEAIERHIAPDGTERGSGPLSVSDVRDRVHRFNRHYFEAAREMGLPVSEDLNLRQTEGVGYYPITTRKGLRCSAADAFLYPAMKQGGITLMKNTLVHRVTLEGRRATGVEVVGGQSIQARKEVILSAGAVNSPQLLQLSGIGPGALLQQQGIPVALANDNVGGNLQDHLAVTWYYKSTERTMNNDLSPWWGKMIAGMQYVLGRRGPLALSVNQCGGFVRSTPEAPRVDLQLYLTPLTYVTTQEPGKRQIVNPDPWPGFLLCHQPSRPTSRGRIDIRSPDPTAQPAIRPNYLSTQEDLDVAIAGGRLIQRMARTQAIQRVIKSPMDPDLLSLDTDESLLEDFRNRSGTVYHPVSTCRMGGDAGSAVVDAQLRVFGIEGLRVADASVFPNVTSGNTNGPTIMLAHKAAESILRAS